MRLLLDANLSPRVAESLRDAGFGAVHVADLDLLTATDDEIFDRAAQDGLVVVTADSDFGALLAMRRTKSPSVIHLRQVAELVAEAHTDLLVANLPQIAGMLAGVTVSSLESLARIRHHEAKPLADADLARLKKELVERDSAGLVEFIESGRTLDDYHGQEALKTWLRQDIALWRTGDLKALPMGYLLCGPVGTGKTYLVECLAGEAGVPVVKLKNFRDRWVGSSEGNLEKIFRLIRALEWMGLVWGVRRVPEHKRNPVRPAVPSA